jgi:rSAM/selenodomain-associated transferase 2/rSAM/selenodomain-associated transferase 1
MGIDSKYMPTSGQPSQDHTASRTPGRGRLILFGRYPVPGRTKTRLIPALGPVGAADLQRRLTQKSLNTILQTHLPASSVEFCYTGGTSHQVRRWLGRRGIGISRQTGEDLGSRMANALGAAFRRGYRPVVLVGTDIPSMTAGHIQNAFQALRRHDIVLGPSRDGGYWLIGMGRPLDLFRDIPWGGADVLARTLAQAAGQGLTVHQLEPLNDIDTETDLAAWQSHGEWRHPYVTVVIPALNEAAAIEKVIRRAHSADSRIIVADGGSADGTVERARRAGAEVIVTKPGRAVQQNAAARLSAGPVLLFLHADTLLPPDYPAQVFETLLPDGVAAGAFRFKTDWNHRSMRLIEKTVRIRSTLLRMPYGDQALFMPKTAFDNAGGFPHVPIAEDLFLVRRIGRLGRISHARGYAVTSGRRWRTLGVWRTTLINYLVTGGCLLGMEPRRLAPLYKKWLK